MPDQLQLRGGTTVQHSTFTGVSKEVTVDTTKKTAVVHDGSTVGGNPLMREDASNSALALASAGTPSLKFSGDSNTGVFSPGADQLAITTGGTSRLAVSTTAVSSTLPVDVPLGAVGTPSLTFTGDLNTGIYSPGADQLAISTNGTEKLIVKSDGTVGLGTSTPSAKLDVEAANFVGGPAIGIRYNTSNPRLGFNVANSNGFVYIGSNTNNKLSSDTSTYDLTGSAASQLRLDGGQLIFNNAPSGTAGNDISFTNRLTITPAGLVGIGTTSPGGILDSKKSGASTTPNLVLTSGGAGDPSSVDPSIQFAASTLESVGTTKIMSTGAYGSRALAFHTGTDGAGTERARIDSSGRLLVGTSSYTGNGRLVAAGNTSGNAGALDICWVSSRPTAAGTDIGYLRWYVAENSSSNAHYASIYASSDGASSSVSDIPGRLVFATTADGASSPTERMRIDSSGRILVGTSSGNANGGILQLSSGITFPATAVAASDANTLDDYEEGTWTPTITGTSVSGSQTYGTRHGGYTKIGRQVTLNFYLALTAKGTIAGNIELSNLPFTTGNNNDAVRYGRGLFGFNNLATSWSHLGSLNDVSLTSLGIVGIKTAASSQILLTASDLNNNSELYGSVVYNAA